MSDETAAPEGECEAPPPGEASPGQEAEPAGHSSPNSPAAVREKLQSRLQALMPIDADHFNPTQLYYIEALAGRAARQPTQVAQALLDKALCSLEGYLASSAQSGDTRDRDSQRTQRELRNGRQLDAIASLTQRLNAPTPTISDNDRAACFAERLRLQEQTLANGGRTAPRTIGEDSEVAHAFTNKNPDRKRSAPGGAGVFTLKAARHRGEADSRRLTQLQLDRAIAQCPTESGPLNPQGLIVQSLKAMRELSPDYLHRLITQLGTLDELEQLASQRQSTRAPKKKRR